MKKLVLLLTILSLTLTSQTIGALASEDIVATKIVRDGLQYVCLDLYNAQIMQARFKLYKEVYEPYSNSMLSNLFLKIENKDGDIFQLETDLIQSKKKVTFYKRVSLLLSAIIATLIISK